MKEKLTIICLIGPMFLFFFWGLFKNPEETSKEERRNLAQIPTLKIESILDNTYFSKWTDYFTDQFPLRNEFRTIKGMVSLNIFKKKEENGVIIKENSLYALNDPLNEKSILHFTNLLNETLNKYSLTNNIYYSIIPDKNYYLEDDTIPKLDYETLTTLIQKEFQEYTYISLFDELNKESYYQTDIHWKQTELTEVLKKLKKEMHLSTEESSYTKLSVSPFYGALDSRIPNNIEAETIEYLTNEIIENATVYNYEKQKLEKVYTKENIHNIDGYDVFLSGASALQIIENKNATNKKELIVFRDSFGSSLIPLLIEEYQKITVIDLRYLSSSYIENIEEIKWHENQDILLLYSVPVINNSFALK